MYKQIIFQKSKSVFKITKTAIILFTNQIFFFYLVLMKRIILVKVKYKDHSISKIFFFFFFFFFLFITAKFLFSTNVNSALFGIDL